MVTRRQFGKLGCQRCSVGWSSAGLTPSRCRDAGGER
jgi:hypothetical protein